MGWDVAAIGNDEAPTEAPKARARGSQSMMTPKPSQKLKEKHIAKLIKSRFT